LIGDQVCALACGEFSFRQKGNIALMMRNVAMPDDKDLSGYSCAPKWMLVL